MLFEGGFENVQRADKLSTPWLPVSAALLLSAGFSLLLSRWLLTGTWEMPEALLRAVIAAALSIETTRIAARAAFAVAEDHRRSNGAACLWLAAAAVWIVPLGALARTGHPLLLPGCAAAGFAAGRILGGIFGSEMETGTLPSWQPRRFLFVNEGASPGRRPSLPWTGAGLLHAGILLTLAGWPAAGALAASAGALAAGFSSALNQPEHRTRIWRARAAAAASASAAVIVTLLVVVRVPERVVARTAAEGSPKQHRFRGYSDPNLLSGAVLIAPAPKMARLQAPARVPPAPVSRRPAVPRKPPQAEIPFSGVYWVLPGPALQPPPNSLMVRDTPLAWQFENVDRQPIWMRAIQELPWPVSSSCCRALEITVTNADKVEGSVALEIVLISRSAGTRRRVSLGVQPVARAGRTVLRFPWNSGPFPAQFDEIRVEFHLAGRRLFRTARVSIESFRFVS